MSPFIFRRASKTCTQKYLAPPAEVFPLLCPVREYEWIHGWKCEVIYSESGFVEEGCIFKTSFPGQEGAIWVTTKHDAENNEVQFIRVVPGVLVVEMKIALEDSRDGGTSACFSYIYTALSDKGNEYVANNIEAEFNHTMIIIEKSMNHFLATGQMLKGIGLFVSQK
ncbi:MAG: hypothetical protein ACYC4H_11965 [Desulfocucumaceae bacterium]